MPTTRTMTSPRIERRLAAILAADVVPVTVNESEQSGEARAIERALAIDPDDVRALRFCANWHASLVLDGFSADPTANSAYEMKLIDRALLRAAAELSRKVIGRLPTQGWKYREFASILMIQGHFKDLPHHCRDTENPLCHRQSARRPATGRDARGVAAGSGRRYQTSKSTVSPSPCSRTSIRHAPHPPAAQPTSHGMRNSALRPSPPSWRHLTVQQRLLGQAAGPTASDRPAGWSSPEARQQRSKMRSDSAERTVSVHRYKYIEQQSAVDDCCPAHIARGFDVVAGELPCQTAVDAFVQEKFSTD